MCVLAFLVLIFFFGEVGDMIFIFFFFILFHQEIEELEKN